MQTQTLCCIASAIGWESILNIAALLQKHRRPPLSLSNEKCLYLLEQKVLQRQLQFDKCALVPIILELRSFCLYQSSCQLDYCSLVQIKCQFYIFWLWHFMLIIGWKIFNLLEVWTQKKALTRLWVLNCQPLSYFANTDGLVYMKCYIGELYANMNPSV